MDKTNKLFVAVESINSCDLVTYGTEIGVHGNPEAVGSHQEFFLGHWHGVGAKRILGAAKRRSMKSA